MDGTPEELIYFQPDPNGEPRFFLFLFEFFLPPFFTFHFMLVVDAYVAELKDREKELLQLLKDDDDEDVISYEDV